jgi:predicted  nucleic acid-binding Zn-ribbon protein
LLKQIAGLNGRITLLSTDLRRLEEDKGKGTAERDELRAEISRLTTQLSGLEAQVEEEVMGKVELQHALQNKGDELQMKVQVHQQQFAEMLSSKSSDVSEAGLKLQQEYEARLAAAIRQLRVDCELQIAANREEQEGLYAMRESALKGEMERMSGALAGKGGELSSIQMKLAALEKRLSGLDGENAALQRSLGEMEMSWQADKAGFSAEKLRLEGIIGEMTAERQQLIADYQGLLEIKVALVNEISTYRALLDGEEER